MNKSWILILLSLAAPAAVPALEKTPGATVIVPYFEVDLDAPDGRTTLVTVGNTGEPVIAHATVWTDWGEPVYAWDLYLGKNAIATYNLRDLLIFGNVAPTRAPAGFGGCGDPVATPALSAADLELLHQQLTGQEIRPGYCVSETRDDITLASGSLTIDTVNECRSGIGQRYPNQNGYFNGSQPRASSQGGLWGDFTLVDPAENFAQGFEAPSFGIDPFATRYGHWPAAAGFAREQLGTYCSRARFLEGGPFAAHSSFFVYSQPPLDTAEDSCSLGDGGHLRWIFQVYDEQGTLAGARTISRVNRTSGRIEAATDLAPVQVPAAGYVELRTLDWFDFPGVPVPGENYDHLLLGAIQASGRFAVGVNGSPLSYQSCR